MHAPRSRSFQKHMKIGRDLPTSANCSLPVFSHFREDPAWCVHLENLVAVIIQSFLPLTNFTKTNSNANKESNHNLNSLLRWHLKESVWKYIYYAIKIGQLSWHPYETLSWGNIFSDARYFHGSIRKRYMHIRWTSIFDITFVLLKIVLTERETKYDHINAPYM